MLNAVGLCIGSSFFFSTFFFFFFLIFFFFPPLFLWTVLVLYFALLCCAVLEANLYFVLIGCGTVPCFLFFYFYFAKSSGYVWYVLCCAVPVGTGRLAGVMYDNMVLVERMSSEEL